MNILDSKLMAGLVGRPCTALRLGERRSLSLEFDIPAGQQWSRGGRPRPDWAIGTYNAAWRIVRGTQVLCGSGTVVDSSSELESKMQKIQVGAFQRIEQLSDFDVRVVFSSGISIDFLAAFSDDDEALHVFAPDHSCLEFRAGKGWTVGRSDVPWTGS